jgi:hypothetical protein
MRRSPRLQDSPADTPRRSPDELAGEGDCGHRRPAEVPDSTGVERPPGTEAAGVRQVRRDLHTAMADRALFSAIRAGLTRSGGTSPYCWAQRWQAGGARKLPRACAHGSGTVRCRRALI